MRCLLFFFLVACGTDTFTGSDGALSPDAGEAGSTTEGGMTARCDPNKPFSNPKSLMELNSPTDDMYARFTIDTLGVLFARNGDLFTAGRQNSGQLFTNIQPITSVNSPDEESWPYLAGNELYFSRAPLMLGSGIFVATGMNFSNINVVPQFAPTAASRFYAPYVIGNAMYLTRFDKIARADRMNGVWGPAVDLASPINVTGSTSSAAALTLDELHIYFASDRSPSQNLDIWGATRATKEALWGQPFQLPLNTSDDDLPTWVSADDCAIAFMRHNQGSYDIWYAQRAQ